MYIIFNKIQNNYIYLHQDKVYMMTILMCLCLNILNLYKNIYFSTVNFVTKS